VERDPNAFRQPEAGDLLMHPKFGRCKVEKTSIDSDFITVRLRNHRLVRLSLEVLDVSFLEEDEEGNQVFRVVPGVQ